MINRENVREMSEEEGREVFERWLASFPVPTEPSLPVVETRGPQTMKAYIDHLDMIECDADGNDVGVEVARLPDDYYTSEDWDWDHDFEPAFIELGGMSIYDFDKKHLAGIR